MNTTFGLSVAVNCDELEKHRRVANESHQNKLGRMFMSCVLKKRDENPKKLSSVLVDAMIV
jgi:hypothetical protein